MDVSSGRIVGLRRAGSGSPDDREMVVYDPDAKKETLIPEGGGFGMQIEGNWVIWLRGWEYFYPSPEGKTPELVVHNLSTGETRTVVSGLSLGWRDGAMSMPRPYLELASGAKVGTYFVFVQEAPMGGGWEIWLYRLGRKD